MRKLPVTALEIWKEHLFIGVGNEIIIRGIIIKINSKFRI